MLLVCLYVHVSLFRNWYVICECVIYFLKYSGPAHEMLALIKYQSSQVSDRHVHMYIFTNTWLFTHTFMDVDNKSFRSKFSSNK